MKNFVKATDWLWKNILKLLIIFLFLITIIALITILIPVFQFADFIGDVLKQMQDLIYEFEKGIEDFPRDKIYQDNEDETV